jgi:hypothetical protein
MSVVRECLRAWDGFWFRTEGSARMRLFRVGLGALLFFNYLVRSVDLELFFSKTGIVPLDAFGEAYSTTWRFSILNTFQSDVVLWIVNFALLASLLTLAFGILPRLSAFIALVAHVSFIHRNLTVHYGFDMIATFYLMFFCLADFRERRPSTEDWRSILGSLALRLSQIQLCVVYAFSGLHKLKGVNWWRGEAIWGVFANPQYARYDFTWVSHFPILIIAMTYGTMLWELYFPVLVWVRRVRTPMLILGLMMHFGIAFTMSLNYFGSLMALIYLLFIDESLAVRVLEVAKKLTTVSKVRRDTAEEYSV